MIKWRLPYNDEQRDAEERRASDSYNDEPSMTVQAHAEDVDINVLMKRFGITDGAVPPIAMDPRYFGDFTDEVSLRDALDRIRTARANFDALPAELRNRFDNDPVKLYAWVNDPANLDEAVELKILSKQGAAKVPKTQAERDAAAIADLQAEITRLQSVQPTDSPAPTPTT